jgi:hypothetical protein
MIDKNRQIYREDIPGPCLEEKAAEKFAIRKLAEAKTKKEKFISDMDEQETDMLYYPRKIKNHEEAIKTENDKSKKLDDEINKITKFLTETNCYNPFKIFSCVFRKSAREEKLEEKVSIAEKIKEYNDVVVEAKSNLKKAEDLLNETAKDYYAFLDNDFNPAQTLYDKCKIAYDICLSKSTRTTPPPPAPLSLSLKSSCKEIKQKIKTFNQKFIYLKYKLLDLNDGINSLVILNIDKNLYDKKIKISKELILKLDELKPPIITTDSYFDDIYKKAQDNLASYKIERKTLVKKIKISKGKVKKIPDKKNSLKTKISNLFKQFKKCLKT